MGSIRKRGKQYFLDYYDCQGVRQRQMLKKGTSKDAAKESLREIEDQVAKGTHIPEKRVPGFTEVAENWLEQKKLNVRASTWAVYRGHIQNHLTEFKEMKVNRITTAMTENFITSKRMEGMHIITLKRIITTLNQVMAYAVRHKYIYHNPVRDAERPQRQGREKEDKTRILIPEEIKAFLDAVTDQKFKVFFKLAITSGARQGELIGLKWSDVDWKSSQIHIQRTFNTGKWYEPKTETSRRRIDLGPSMIKDLKKWKLACPPNDLNLIFPNKAGNPMGHGEMLRYQFKPALKKAGLSPARFHDLRHTFASLLIEQKENIKYIQSQLGHSSPMVTLNIYGHLMKDVNQESPRRLENTLFK
jgi:integrase